VTYELNFKIVFKKMSAFNRLMPFALKSQYVNGQKKIFGIA